jgi:hypothetical protein
LRTTRPEHGPAGQALEFGVGSWLGVIPASGVARDPLPDFPKQKPKAKTAADGRRSGTQGSNSLRLDQVDLSGEIARDLEANFLLANFGLRPRLHGVSSSYSTGFFLLTNHIRRQPLKFQSLFANACPTFRDHDSVICYIISLMAAGAEQQFRPRTTRAPRRQAMPVE